MQILLKAADLVRASRAVPTNFGVLPRPSQLTFTL
jgi:hypothetical protein